MIGIDSKLDMGVDAQKKQNGECFGVNKAEPPLPYNYLNDVSCGSFTSDTFHAMRNGVGGWIRSINCKHYDDPDAKSRRLYEDLCSCFLNQKLPNGNSIEIIELYKERKGKYKDNATFYETEINIVSPEGDTVAKIGLGADYIGPSIHWACEAGLNPKDIGAFLEMTRTLGGHIMWPRWIGIPKDIADMRKGYLFIRDFNPSISVARGGEKGFYDRIDLFLFDLREWFFKQRCKLQRTYDKNKIWFDQFEDFKQFVDFFGMNDYVSGDDYLVKNLCSFHSGEMFRTLTSNNVYPASVPSDKISFSKFSDANVCLVNLRNKQLRL